MGRPALAVRDLTVEFALRSATVRAVDGVSFDVAPGKVVGVLGESGSGKSVTMLAVLGLVPRPGRIVQGSVRLGDTDLTTLRNRDINAIRGTKMAYIPPDAGASLNPVVRVGVQVSEGLVAHAKEVSRRDRYAKVLNVLRDVGLARSKDQVRRYPHELSGGMQQRVAIAMGVQLGPGLLIADEPTTALDVTIQAQILRLLLDIRRDHGTAILYVTHDIATVAEVCDRVLVMYAGQLVETGSVVDVCTNPRHPYTQALLDSVPPLGGEPPEMLRAIPGSPPDARSWPPGCRFAQRCWLRAKLDDPLECTTQMPVLTEYGAGRSSRCHFAGEMAGSATSGRHA